MSDEPDETVRCGTCGSIVDLGPIGERLQAIEDSLDFLRFAVNHFIDEGPGDD